MLDSLQWFLPGCDSSNLKFALPCLEFASGPHMDSQIAAAAEWLRVSNIFRQICKSTFKWGGFESRWFYQSGFEFAKTALFILNH